VFHQTRERARAHVLVRFLGLALWRTLQQWMEAGGLDSAARKPLEEMREARSLDVVPPAEAGPEVRLRTISRPDRGLAILLERLDFPPPNGPKRIQNVVEKIRRKDQKTEQTLKSCL